MLQSIRDRAQGWIAWVIVGLIILTFALFGIDQYARGDKVVVVAEVNGQDVTGNAFMRLYSRQKSRLEEQFGDMYDQVVDDEELRLQVLDALIESELMRQWANDNGMLVTDQQLAAMIHSAEAFQKDGKFSEKVYEDVLMRNGLNIARFEYEQRQYLLEGQFFALTMSGNFATPFEVEQLAKLQGQERNVNYLRIDQRPFLKTVKVTEAEIKAAYDKDKALYVEAEKVSIDYIDLSQAEIAKTIEVNDELIQAYYDENSGLFTLPEKRHAKHILIPVEADTEEAKKAVLKTIAEIQEKLATGEAFEVLAKTYSKDPGSASSGGDLGTFEQGMMVPEFDEVVFALEVGQVSEPVKTDFGYHIIKLEGVEPKQVQPLETVKSKVIEQYKMEEAERQYFDLLEQLTTVVYEQSDSLEPASDAVGFKVKTSELFTHDGGVGDILSNTKVLSAAFSDELLKENLNSEAIELSSHHSVFIRVNQHVEQRQKPLEEVVDSIKEQLTRQAAIKEATVLAEQLLAKVKAGENPESLMQNGIEWNAVGWIARNAQKVLPQIVSEAFKIAKPTKEGETSWGSFQLNTGDTILLQISGVKAQPVSDEDKQALNQAFSELFGGAQYKGRLEGLKIKADIVRLPAYKTVK
ncbi:Peptidyl-prolyl cis-trans isomerase PpiD [hydrothermal vent metagenome]|uniref:Periplasmic chaperone PpiD n=1 Tax=hydrothermal vent metagenome TaxID=652676 RepID=A0A3B0WZ02_9ZZZZ